MRGKKMLILLFLLAAIPMFAQAPGATGSGLTGGEIKFLGAVVGMAIASGLCGLGQGKAAASAAEAIARNPGARAGINLALILGLAFIESLAIYTLLVVYTK